MCYIVTFYSHGKVFAHFTEESKALLSGDWQPAFRLRKRKLEDTCQVKAFARENDTNNVMVPCECLLILWCFTNRKSHNIGFRNHHHRYIAYTV